MFLDRRDVDAAYLSHVLRESRLAHQLAGPLQDPRHAGLADEHVMRFFGEHEAGRPRQRIERALRQRHELRFAVAVGEHREHEEIEPVVDRLVEGFQNARLVAVPALPIEQFFGFIASVASEVRVQQVDHRPQVTSFLDVHLKQIAQIVEAWASVAERPLLLDACRLDIALRHDQPPQLIPELAGHFVPHRLAEEVAESDAPIGNRIGEEDAPTIFGQLDVLEVRPPARIDADRRANVDLVVILEPLRSHVAPPLDVLRLPMLERALQALVAREVHVVRNLLGGDHLCSSPRYVLFQSNSGRPCCPYTLSAPFSPTAFGRWKIQFCHAESRPKIFVSIVSGPAKRRLASMPVSASGDRLARSSMASRTSSSQSISSGANVTSPASSAVSASMASPTGTSAREGSFRKRVCRRERPLPIGSAPRFSSEKATVGPPSAESMYERSAARASSASEPAKHEPASMTASRLRAVRSRRFSTRFMWWRTSLTNQSSRPATSAPS